MVSRDPVEFGTRFQIGSVTKSLVAYAFVELARTGRVDLQTPVSRHSDWIELPDERITFHQLLSHTSGLIGLDDTVPSSRYAVWKLRKTTVGFEPGSDYHYSNMGYMALGYLLTEITGMNLDEAIRQIVLAPLGLAETQVEATVSPASSEANGHYRDASGHLRPFPPIPARGGHAGAVATANDVGLFLRTLLDDGPTAQLMGTPITSTDWPGFRYGYGLFNGQPNALEGHRIIHHGGENPGFESVMLGDLDTGAGVVVLVNSYYSPWITAYFALRSLNAALAGDQQPTPPHPQGVETQTGRRHPTKPRRRHNATFVGYYRAHAPMVNEFWVYETRGKLMVDGDGISEQPLTPINETTFAIGTDHTPERIEFGPIADGTALACTISGGLYVRI